MASVVMPRGEEAARPAVTWHLASGLARGERMPARHRLRGKRRGGR